MENSIVTTKGQVVIPAKLRKKYDIKPGTKVHFYDDGDEIKIVPITKDSIRSSFGVFKTKGKLLKVLAEEKKFEREL